MLTNYDINIVFTHTCIYIYLYAFIATGLHMCVHHETCSSFLCSYSFLMTFVMQGPKTRRLLGIIYGDTSKNRRGVFELAILQFSWCL